MNESHLRIIGHSAIGEPLLIIEIMLTHSFGQWEFVERRIREKLGSNSEHIALDS